MVKNLPAIQETWVWSLGQEDPLEKGMDAHTIVLAWKIPWTEKLGGLQFKRLQRVEHNWVTNKLHHHCLEKSSLNLKFKECQKMGLQRHPLTLWSLCLYSSGYWRRWDAYLSLTPTQAQHFAPCWQEVGIASGKARESLPRLPGCWSCGAQLLQEKLPKVQGGREWAEEASIRGWLEFSVWGIVLGMRKH